MQTDTRPRFRQDLIAEPVEDNGGRFVDLLNPDSGNVFRFYEVEFALACAMDGERDIPGIVQWAKEELGLSPSQNEVRSVIATLGELGYLEGGAAQPAVTVPAAAQPAAAKQPAAAAPQAGLAPGVVTQPKKPAQPSVDVELGQAGSKVERVAAAELPQADELELGAPGTVPAARNLDLPRAEDVALGQSGRTPAVSQPEPPSEVSIDLADHLSVGAEDVKEAVRASQVMRAVDVPPELAAVIESRSEPEPARPVERREPTPESRRPEPRPEPVARPEPRPEAVARPEPQRSVEQPKPVEEQPAKRGPSLALVLLLVLVLVGAGAFLAWQYLLKKQDPATPQATAPAQIQPATPKPPVEAPKPPPVETQKLALEQPEALELKPIAAGQIETIVANDSVVKPGDTVVRLAGGKPIETEIAAIARDIEKRVKPELAQAEKDRDAAQAAGNKGAQASAEARITDRTKSLQDKGAKLAAKQAELEKYVLKSTVDGKVTVSAKQNARVTPNDVVATITRSPVLVATFHAAPLPANTKVLVAAGEQKLGCVTAASTDGVKVVCPADAAKEGTEVSFIGPDPNAPPPGSEIELDEDANGSAAGSASAPAAGSAAGSAAAGSAAAPADKAAATPARPRPARAVARPQPATDTPAEPAAPAPTPAPAEPAPPAGSAQ